MVYGEKPPKDRNVFVRVGFGRKQQSGDLILPDTFPFIVEVKNRKVTFSSLLSEIKKWCEPYENMPEDKGLLLVFKYERKWWCAVDEKWLPAPKVAQTLGSCFTYRTPDKSMVIFPLAALKEVYPITEKGIDERQPS